jgi:hypothetical protein
MAITVTTTQTESVAKIKYPILGIYPDGTIVLFSDVTSGTVLKGDTVDSKVGHYYESWADYRDPASPPSAKWVPYHGTVTISNEAI